MNRISTLKIALVAVLIACGLVAAFLLGGCQVGTTGLLRPLSPESEHTITNIVGAVTSSAGAAAPQPIGYGIEVAGGVILSLLAAWQTLTHRAVTKLRVNGGNPSKDIIK
jgi:hypothetical protein